MATRPTAKDRKQRREAKDCCDWAYWQEILTDDDGYLCDAAGERLKGTNPAPIMVWRQRGTPCGTCLAEDFRKVTNRCAEAKCKRGSNCPQHRYRYTDAPCFGCGHYHKRKSETCCVSLGKGKRCKCSEVVAWPESYPPPASAQETKDGERKAIQAYHRGSDGAVKLRQRQQEAKDTEDGFDAMLTRSPESNRYWAGLAKRLTELNKPDAITAMARRCLRAQQEASRYADSFGEGLGGTIILEVGNAKTRLAALIAEQEADAKATSLMDDEEDDYIALEDEDDEEDDYITGQRRMGRNTDDEEAGIDLEYLML